MRIVNLNTMTFQPSVTETDISQVRPGTEVDTTADAVPGRTFHGYVTAVYPAADNSDRGFTIRVSLNNPDGVLKPGMFARGSIVTAVHRNVPLVPADALVADATQAGYTPNTSSNQAITSGSLVPPQYVVVAQDDNTALVQQVKIGIINPNFAEITSGVTPGQHIIEVGQTTLKTGDKISIQNDGSHQKRQQTAYSTPSQAAS
jgi:Cu(I)/Ag(I) efflux system membrane fusion protein